MRKLVMTHGQHFHDHKGYETCLYRLLPKGPVRELCKLVGLPKPAEEPTA
jgi:sulfur relay (sulfurtransferase) DsrC/TusE family protein